MTCPHCGFENLETNVNCFRCGQEIDLSNVEVDPPRRTGRVPVSMLRVWNRTQARPELSRGQPALAAVLSLVPGLGHYIVLVDPRRALVMFCVWVGAMVAAWGQDPPVDGAVLLEWLSKPHWLSLTAHVWIVTDAYQRCLRRDGQRAQAVEMYLVSLATVAVLCSSQMGGFWEEMGERARGYVRERIQAPLFDPTVRMDDVMLVHEGDQRPLMRGVVVVYDSFAGHQNGRDMVGTILAGGGDRVVWQQARKRLLVNGQPVVVPPLQTESLSTCPDQSFYLNSDELLVFPLAAVGTPQAMVIHTREVHGVVLRIVDPISRRRNLQ